MVERIQAHGKLSQLSCSQKADVTISRFSGKHQDLLAAVHPCLGRQIKQKRNCSNQIKEGKLDSREMTWKNQWAFGSSAIDSFRHIRYERGTFLIVSFSYVLP